MLKESATFLPVQNIRRLILAKFLSSLYFTVPIQTLFFFAKGLKFSEVMLLESILLIGILLFEIPTGVIADKIGRKWSLVSGALLGLIAWIPWFLADGFALFAVSFFLSGIAIAFQSGCDQALIFDDLKNEGRAEEMQKVIGKYFGSITLAVGLASLIGGYLATSQNLDAFYALYKLNVAMQSAGLLVLLSVRESRSTKEGEEREHATEKSLKLFLDGLRHLLRHRKLRRIFLLSIFTLPFSFVLVYIFQPYFTVAGVAPLWFGIAVSTASLLSLSAKFFAYRIEKFCGAAKGAFLVSALPGVIWLVMATVFHPLFSVIVYIMNDAAGNLRDPIFSDYLNRHIESRNRATVLSTISLAGSLYSVMIRPVIGFLADIDLRYGFVLMGMIILIAAIIFRIGEDDIETVGHS